MAPIRHVLSAQQFSKEDLETIFARALEMEKNAKENPLGLLGLLPGRIMISLFYEPSTRTRISFGAAMRRLGGSVEATENAGEFSSAAKGESLKDSIMVTGGYGDIIVLRHPEEGAAEMAAKFSRVPIINAGDGAGQHPTQALLDLFTIKKKFGEIEGLTIVMAGDLLNGRTVRSLSYLVGKHYGNNRIIFTSPPQVKMKDDIKEFLAEHSVLWEETEDFSSAIKKADVIYHTRVQKERFKKGSSEIYEEVVRESAKFVINEESLSLMKRDAIIMHPLPRLTEISHVVDNDPRAIYFEQAKNGLWVRMALLHMILS